MTPNGRTCKPQGHIPLGLVSVTFGINCSGPFALHEGRGKYCMSFVLKVYIYFSDTGFAHPEWSNLSAPGSYTPWFQSLLGSTVAYHLLCMQDKESTA